MKNNSLKEFENYINKSNLTFEKKKIILTEISNFKANFTKEFSLSVSSGVCPTCGK